MSDVRTVSDPQSLAETVAEAMFGRDGASKSLLGVSIVKMAPGYAKVTMTVRPEMLNGHRTCHGGIIFALADSAFGFSSNSYNLNTVAAGCSIEFLMPAYEGDVLTAEAVELHRAGKTGVYDVTVSNQSGQRVALFRGKSHQVKGEVLEALAN